MPNDLHREVPRFQRRLSRRMVEVSRVVPGFSENRFGHNQQYALTSDRHPDACARQCTEDFVQRDAQV
jgi:hypothetical protein